MWRWYLVGRHDGTEALRIVRTRYHYFAGGLMFCDNKGLIVQLRDSEWWWEELRVPDTYDELIGVEGQE